MARADFFGTSVWREPRGSGDRQQRSGRRYGLCGRLEQDESAGI
jgi:hypothetical protein